jgi:hypothetical protein
MPPKDRKRFMEKMRRWKKLSPEERKKIRTRVHKNKNKR